MKNSGYSQREPADYGNFEKPKGDGGPSRTTVLRRRLGSSGGTGANWPHYGGSYRFWRYSTLDQIRRDNIKQLAPVLGLPAGSGRRGAAGHPDCSRRSNVSHVFVNRVFALDATTGAELGTTTTRIRGRLESFTAPGTVA